MRKNRTMLFIFLLLVSNILVFIFTNKYTRESYARETKTIYDGLLGRYLVELDNNNTKLVQTYLSGIIFPSIVNLEKQGKIDDNYKYLCESWSKGLDIIIRKEFSITDSCEEKMNKDYLVGAKKLDQFCATKSSALSTK
jgi:hypothetical protein